MADSHFLVTISGPALSLLFYENVRSRGDQMGFLLGETLEFVVKSYTDADMQVETVKIYNNIETIVTCPLPESLHNSIGRINKEKLKDFLCDKSKQVIGWFHFRRNMSLTPTFRDKILHKEFASYFSNNNGSKEEFFVTCLLSSSTSSEGGTHKFKHVFLRQKRRIFEPVPLRISNLGSNSFIHERSDYKPTPTRKSSDAPDVFTKLIESLNLDLTRTSGIESAIAIQKAAEQHLSQLIPELCKSDLEVAELEKQIKEFKLNKKAKMNGNSDNVDQQYEIKKNEISKNKQQSEKISPSRLEASGDTYHECRVSQPIFSHEPQNATTYVEKNVNQSNSRRIETMNSPNQEPSAVNSVSEIKPNVAESILIKNTRFVNMDSENVKESICKYETWNARGIGRGRGKFVRNFYPELEKAKTADPAATHGNSSIRTSHTQVPQQESSEAGNSVQNTSLQLAYNQVVKKKVKNTHKSTNTTDSH
ncbi:BRISC complex subunit FAM175B [Anthophora quadrimaculata]